MVHVMDISWSTLDNFKLRDWKYDFGPFARDLCGALKVPINKTLAWNQNQRAHKLELDEGNGE